ncbi:SIS domain-containing protein [Lawsonia intracellularis]|uniref:Phosphoheptose isomerase n=1 Tax=Lawsonia intracellularis (strain PHE/MN1-00) TaxID=363253 RepID=Q1MP15_LAWIP|nr:SIS domain-containing protein [Lawsonia intracellularis]AGC50637.1 phosphoheptose isomerase [Lawsonia intracellularis N343]KAA0204250.1 SIS domain-containing protein [Lawsonia intracellularis]MBZ3893379.1 SIS domain-containing protein [Lawsonia intracellularis]OMQ02031.1 phosphoheptose isomerase [Lawsonia intracellularis]RBN31837.1 SIS domain-containing protein [Lawsonia intracellularis]
MQISWNNYVQRISKLLTSVEVSISGGNSLSLEDGFIHWVQKTEELRNTNRTVFFIGNGASASMASHFSADLTKNAQINTKVFTDLSLLTAIGNDLGFEYVFSVPFARDVCSGDMLVVISCSGESPNVVNTIRLAQSMQEKQIFCVSLTGKHFSNTVRQLGDLNFYVPTNAYGECESCHAIILHHWMDSIQVKS